MHDSGGGDIVAAYWALRQKAVLFDVPERPIEISGPGALAFLETIFKRRISRLEVGWGYNTLACTHSGGLIVQNTHSKCS